MARPRTMVGSLLVGLERAHAELNAVNQISIAERYRTDPVGFAREVLLFEPTPKQQELLIALRDRKRVAVKSSHKAGKSSALCAAALWFWACFPGGRVILFAPTGDQLNKVLWREITRLFNRARDRFPRARLYEKAQSGLKAPDLSEIKGFTAKHPENLAGISAPDMLWLLDEATGIPDNMFDVVRGNMAGGAYLAMASNPTKPRGFFYEAFTSKEHLYSTHSMTAFDSANVLNDADVTQQIPGLATLEWIEEMKDLWGEDSASYKVRVLGEFVEAEEGRIITLDVLRDAQLRWDETKAEGPIYLGVDPSGEGTDESAFCLRRGKKVLKIVGHPVLKAAEHVEEALKLIQEVRRDDPTYDPKLGLPTIIVDAEGTVGSDVINAFRGWALTHPNDFKLISVRGSKPAIRRPLDFGTIADELWRNTQQWLEREELALPPDSKLERDLITPSWEQDHRGRSKVTPKSELRKILGRSPDRGDALNLSLWTTPSKSDIHLAIAQQDMSRFLPRGDLAGRGGLPSPYGGIGYGG